MSFLSNALNMLDSFNPVSKLLDAAGDALGLPPELKRALKVGGGIATGNVVMIAAGAANAADDVARHQAVSTEYLSGSSRWGALRGGQGYAPASGGSSWGSVRGEEPAATSGSSPGAGGAVRHTGPLDPSVLDYRDALRTLSANFEMLDTLRGSNNDKFDLRTLTEARDTPRLPANVREAAGFLLAHPEYRNQLDTAGKGGSADGTISRRDLDQALRNVSRSIAEHGVREPAPGTPAPSTPPRPSPVPGGSGSPLDPELHDYLSALKTLEANFATLDGASGTRDNRISLEDLRSMAGDGRLSPELRKAVHFLSTNPGYFERLDTALPGFGVGPPGMPGTHPRPFGDDGAFELEAVRTELGRVEAELRRYGAPSAAYAGSAGGTQGQAPRASDDVASILRDPGMSMEEKIQLVLAQIMESSDAEIAKTMEDLAAAQDRQAGIQNSPENQRALSDAKRNAEQIQLRLQNLMEKRKAMFELMSHMSTKFNEMAKTAISNLARA